MFDNITTKCFVIALRYRFESRSCTNTSLSTVTISVYFHKEHIEVLTGTQPFNHYLYLCARRNYIIYAKMPRKTL